MKIWDAWLPDVLPHVAGCPDVLARHEIKRAAQAFFRDSLSWRAVLEPLTIDVGEPEVRVFPDDSEAEIVRVEHAVLGGCALKPLSLDATARAFGADWMRQTGEPEAVTATTPIRIRLVPYPTAPVAEKLSLVVSLVPAEDASGISDELYARYREAIAIGARARLMLIVGQPWSNPDFGAALSTRFDAAVSEARTDIARAHGRATPRSRPTFC